MTVQQKQQILELREEGYSVREIASELNLPKTAVGNIVNGSVPGAIAAIELDEKRISKDSSSLSDELGRLEMELKHERAMKELSIKEKEVDLRRKQLEVQEIQAENTRQQLENEQLNTPDDQEVEQQTKQEEKFLGRYEALLGELVENCQESTWTVSELDEVIRRGGKLQTDVQRYCDLNDFDYDDLSIYQHLEKIMDLTEDWKDGHTSAKIKVDVDLTDEEQKQLELRLGIIDFYDSVSDDTDEEDENQEEMPIRALKGITGTDEEEDSTSNGSNLLAIGAAVGLAGLLFSGKRR